MRMKRCASITIGIDRDPDVIDLWRKRGLPERGELRCGDATKVLRSLNLQNDDLVYSDPPYPESTRRGGKLYRYDMNDEEHAELLQTLKSLPCKVMVSSYDNELYRECLQDWQVHEFAAVTHNGTAREVLWTNYRPGSELHDYSYIGHDFREREKIRRRRETLIGRLGKIDELELNAVLADLAGSRPDALRAALRRVA